MDLNLTELKFWFTHVTSRYDVTGLREVADIGGMSSFVRSVHKTEQKVKLDWDSCTLDIVGKFSDPKDSDKEKLKVVLRSNAVKKSSYMGKKVNEPKDVLLRYMLGIDILSVSDVWIEDYALSKDNYIIRENIDSGMEMQQYKIEKRVVFRLDERYWIWDWYDGSVVTDTSIFKLREYLNQNIESSSKMEKDIFRIPIDENEIDLDRLNMSKVIPIIYQPAMDSLKNYVRQVHCAEIEPNVYEISIVFNNEVLRQHRIFDGIYKLIRKMMYHRTTDIETFRIYLDDTTADMTKCKCLFENIYSEDKGIEYDSIHGDRPEAEFRPLKYSQYHYHCPIIFINTSNHAMAPHDNNQDLWKWEYIPFVKNSPLEFGKFDRRSLNTKVMEMSKKSEKEDN